MNQLLKAIIFKINEQKYGVNVNDVRSIEKLHEITQLPQTSTFVKGVINLRDEVIPIIDLKELLSLGKTTQTEETRILIVQIRSRQVGIIVDAATDVIDIHLSVVDSPPEITQTKNNHIVKGVAKVDDELLIIVQFEKLFDEEQLVHLETLHTV
ncbi:MAG TPA: chemotaxis protein CheW [Bacillota bacterium]|nr:chemotaxis protein CheW [Bacillota bacterium]